jgi:DNA modification methylase
MDAFTLHHGDCLDVLRTMPDASIDSIVTDPPYGIGFQSQWVERGRRKPKIAGDDSPFVWFIRDAARVLKDGGGFICFCEWRHAEAFRLALSWAGLQVKSQIVWDRAWHGMGDLKASFAPTHDLAWFATKGAGFAFPGKRPKSVIRAMRPSGADAVHPTQKPDELMRQLVSAITPAGGVVLDPFTGSGSTGKAAMLEGLRFIGIEREAEYVEIARARIQAAIPPIFGEVA